MSGAQRKVGTAQRGLIALGIAAAMATVGMLAGYIFATLARMEEGSERSIYIWSVIALSIPVTLLIIFGGSRLFLRTKSSERDNEERGRNRATDTGDADGEAQRQQRGFTPYAEIFVFIVIVNIYFELLDRAGESFGEILALDGPPMAVVFALGVTPIMAILAIAERPDGAWIRWRTVYFTAALWPAAVLADLFSSAPASYDGLARFATAYSPIFLVVAWIAVGGALGTLDAMFSLANPQSYEKRLKGIAFLAEGCTLWHGVPFLLLLLSMRWQDSWNSMPEIAGNPLYFAGVLAATTVALSRPHSTSGWVLAVVAGAAVAALTLGGAVIAGNAIEASATAAPLFRFLIYMSLALPGLATAFAAIWLLTMLSGRRERGGRQ